MSLAEVSQWSLWLIVAIGLSLPIVVMFLMPRSRARAVFIRAFLLLVGGISLILGIIGIFLPVLPTTPFILLTAGCWARVSPQFHQWLRQHRYFGKMVVNWEQNRAVPRKAKWLAWCMMAFSCALLFYRFPQRWYVGVLTSLICLAVGLWMARLLDAPMAEKP